MKKIGGFDLLKIIAATLIVFHHYQQVFQANFEYINFFDGKIYFGYLVELFFIISGFLTSFTPPPEMWSNWWRKKLVRIYPMVTIACLFALMVNSVKVSNLMAVDIFGDFYSPKTVSALDALWNIKTLVANFLLLFSGWPYFSMMGINNPTWYCCVLIQCYIAYFILMKLAECFAHDTTKIRPYLFIAVIICMYPFYRFNFIELSTFRGINTFFMGCCLCEIYKRVVINRSIILILSLLTLISLIAAIRIPKPRLRIFLFGLFPPLVLLATQINCWNWVHEFAQVSFEVFIWHSPLMAFEKMIMRVFELPNFERTYASMIIFTIGVWLFSWIMYKFVEKPTNRFLCQEQKVGE